LRGGAQMINSRFRYASANVGFGTPSASLQKMKASQANTANSLASAQSLLSSITSSLASAQQDKINGLGTLAAQAAIARVKADAAAKSKSITDQIDAAQKSLTDAQSTTTSTKPIIIGNTIIQPYVSWGSPPGTVAATDDHPVYVVGTTVIQKNYQSWVYTPPVATTDTTA
jgi:hypothetical protein